MWFYGIIVYKSSSISSEWLEEHPHKNHLRVAHSRNVLPDPPMVGQEWSQGPARWRGNWQTKRFGFRQGPRRSPRGWEQKSSQMILMSRINPKSRSPVGKKKRTTSSTSWASSSSHQLGKTRRWESNAITCDQLLDVDRHHLFILCLCIYDYMSLLFTCLYICICWNASLIAQMEVLFPTLQNRWF